MKEIATFAAICADCGSSFSHPLLSEFSYGEIIFYTVDGKNVAVADAFGTFAQRVAALHKRGACKPHTFWPALASLADPVAGQPLTANIRCSHCGSKNLASWGDGNKTGSAQVPAASFTIASAYTDEELAKRVMAISDANIQA